MSSIFIRIYGGLLLAILTVALLAYGAFLQINDWRAERYRENMASGVFHLIAIGVARHDGPGLPTWLAETGRLMETELKVVGAKAHAFSLAERARLRDGRAIVRLNEAENTADIYARVPGPIERYVWTRMTKVSEQQAKAMAGFLLEDLGHFPQAWRVQRVRELQRYFGFPLETRARGELGLDRDHLARLARGEVVLVLKEGRSSSDSNVKIVAPLPASNDVVVMGPMYLFEWLPVELVLGLAFAALVVITLGAYFIIHPLEVKLNRMASAVRQIRAGDLSARADEKGWDEVSRLAQVFNGMAEHIQRLIGSQREMVRAVSHELRTPVARLRFGIEMMADTEEAEERHRQLEGLDQDVDQLNQLIDEILTYARLEEGTPSLRFELVDVQALTERLRQETQALGTAITIELALPARLPEIRGEERYLHRLLQNLVGNALRYARSRVRLSAGCHGAEVWLSVEDDGPGIPEKDRQRVFEPFARLDDSRTRSSGGYGLGLSIVARIAFWHRGRVVVDSSPNLGGARFIFFWPRNPEQGLDRPVNTP